MDVSHDRPGDSYLLGYLLARHLASQSEDLSCLFFSCFGVAVLFASVIGPMDEFVSEVL